MGSNELDTYCKKTWCPGCSDFAILSAIKMVITEFMELNIPKEEFVMTTGIGCHGKIFDYLNINGFYGLHGRAIPLAEGIKLANPKLKVITFVGDGDTYNEGLDHLLHAAKRNSDITVFVHDNRNFALTVSQFTATSPRGFKGSTTPEGSLEIPMNPLLLMLSTGATFIARAFTLRLQHMKKIMKEAILHKGFSFVEILQPCPTFFDTTKFYAERVYEVDTSMSREEALEKIQEWNYEDGAEKRIPIGIFYQVSRPTFEELI